MVGVLVRGLDMLMSGISPRENLQRKCEGGIKDHHILKKYGHLGNFKVWQHQYHL